MSKPVDSNIAEEGRQKNRWPPGEIFLRPDPISASERKEHTVRNFFVGLFLAALLPFIVGFGDVPPDKNIEQVTAF